MFNLSDDDAISAKRLFNAGPAELIKDMIAEESERARDPLIDCLHDRKQTRVPADPRLSGARRDGDADPKAPLQFKPRRKGLLNCDAPVINDIECSTGEARGGAMALETSQR